ncbi:hypothetical protein FNV43_RR25987 [Rhamnella rubrinervis]|uniref:protein-disulfide reductase n=1 Tax=Rhamnella rubrinervis TaxID=2594499 RepID=A0A8K0DU52_9ROSA|nr:hypothetical protein FNV43_RR25987 [Rhamnella rubrinervis]
MANGVAHDLSKLLSSEERDFLIRNNGDQVKVSSLVGKIVGLYFSGSWCGPCRRFTPKLLELYEELASKGNFEVVFISSDKDDESFKEYFSEMPWLAIPFTDLETRKRLKELFKVRGIPNLVIIDENGHVSTEQGTRIVMEYGVDGYPFNVERINFLKEEEEAAKQNQTLSSILVSSSRDYLVSNDGNRVPVSELEGKLVGLYFSMNYHGPCREFTPKLVEVYKKLKEKGQDFEIVLISLDHDDEQFKEGFETMPWLALPFNDKSIEKLLRYFELQTLPTLVIIGPDGKTLNPNVAELIEEHGIEAYPFTPEKLIELAEIEKAKLEAQTLESLLVYGDKDFVIEKNGSKVPVSELVGKTILLYFSAHWCPPCRAFLPKLIKTYNDIRATNNAFEVVFISSDHDQSAFDEFYSGMPWLALPFGDERKKSLQRKFKVQGIPTVIAISPSGRTLTTTARQLIGDYGVDAYPFTEEHLKRLEEIATLKKNEETKEPPKAKEGNVCDGDVCRKA